MTLRTSLVITGDTAGAQDAVDDLRQDVDKLDASTEGATRSTRGLDSALRTEATSARAAGTAQQGAATSARGLSTAQASAAATARAAAVAQGSVAAASVGAATGMTAQAAAAGLAAVGTSALTAAGAALAGVLSGVLTGGISLVVAAVVPLVAGLFGVETGLFGVEEGAEEADAGLKEFGARQADIANFIDFTTGKLIEQNKALVENAILTRKNRIDEVQTAARTRAIGIVNTVKSREVTGSRFVAERQANATTYDIGLYSARKAATNDSGQIDFGRYTAEVGKLGAAYRDLYDAMVVEEGRRALDSRTIIGQRREMAALQGNDRILRREEDEPSAPRRSRGGGGGGRGGAKRPPSPRRGANDNDAADAGSDIATMLARYATLDAPFAKAEAEVRKLDGAIAELSKKKPPNFEAMIVSAEEAKIAVQRGLLGALTEGFQKQESQAEKAAKRIAAIDSSMADLEQRRPPNFERMIATAKEAKGVIEDSLLQPYNDYLSAHEEQLAIQRLINAGREDEADALRIINGLEKQGVPLTEARKDAIRGTVAELRMEGRELDRLRQSQQKYLGALGDVRGTITGVIADPRRIAEAPGELLDTFKQLSAEYLFEKMFGDVFEQLQDEITGNGAVQRSAMKTSGSFDEVTKAARRAAAAMNGVAAPDEVVVTGDKSDDRYTPKSTFERLSYGLLTKGIGLDDAAAQKIAKGVGKGFEGAMQGQMASGVASMLGIKQSSTGAAIGGAIGNFLPFPGGSIIGGLLGGTIGGLFQKPKYSTASVTGMGDASVSGSNGELRKAAGGLVDQVQGGLKQIADQLGGSLGAFSLSIGTWDGKYRVNTQATNKELHYNNFNSSTLHNFDDDAAGAVAFAIADAVRDGAVTGLSAAVQKAVKSSPDIEAALAEALKVADLELVLGGVNAEMIRSFKSFETQAKDRLRIATEYGLDVVATEKLNAKERLALTDQLMEQQVGSLQRLITEMTSGGMFEGTSVERRDVLLSEIDKAKADMDAGVAGAADRLAGLFEQLNAVSKEVYGTTGGFTVDRSRILDEARAAIAKANADIKAAQSKASDPALTQTNAALDENNDQNARIIDALGENNRLIAAFLKQGGVGFNLGGLVELARTS